MKIANKENKKFWVRQVVVPELHDNRDYLLELDKYIKNHINISNIEKIEFLPYHKLGTEKYEHYNIDNPYITKEAMDKNVCEKLYK